MNKNKLSLALFSMFSAAAMSAPLDVIETQFDNTRVFFADGDVIYGHAAEKNKKNGSYFTFSFDSNELILGEKKMSLVGEKFIEKDKNTDDKFNKKVLSYFSQRYGIKYADGAAGDVYVFLDYSCPFSRKFVESGELNSLSKQGKNVWVMPISRLGSVEGISNYSALTCMMANDEQKLERFLDWMEVGSATVSRSELQLSKCYYWLDLKPYYGIMEKLKLNGVPSVVEVK
ncbi:hypothetical protein OTK49_21630 [Vibrio coralliirubri]|uniref:hypothetical protein n=1 Tax=Vibrio coralliirubri TaxID=1516159 RepID=UPI0022840642|nr:hypothetical protein [Vibrio coralliirubri]MCY9865124.1 hypothetical protein [Vibrio coralliirubri]